MRRSTMTVICVLAVVCMCVAQGSASVTAYVSNPHTNSVDWANAVIAAGGQITTLNFNSLATGPLALVSTGNYALNSYQASDGVRFAVKGNAPAITYGVRPGSDSGVYSQNNGEGTHSASNYLSFPMPGFGTVYTPSITVNFDDPVSAVGFSSIDLASWTSSELLTIEAFSGPDATGTALGSATSYNPAFFQPSYVYFMGLASTSNDIQSFRIRGNWQSPYVGDNVGFDDFKFGRMEDVPEPSALALLGFGAISLLAYVWRRHRS